MTGNQVERLAALVLVGACGCGRPTPPPPFLDPPDAPEPTTPEAPLAASAPSAAPTTPALPPPPKEGCVEKLVVGGTRVCVIRTDDALWCWGDEPGGGVTGEAERAPQPVLDEVVDVASGRGHACATKKDGSVWCWGTIIDVGNYDTPVRMPDLEPDLRALTVGELHTCALRNDGTVWCMGANARGELAALGGSRGTPVKAATLSKVEAITAGSSHTCAIRDDRSLWCWGHNVRNQLGAGEPSVIMARPVRAKLGGKVLAVSAAAEHSCAVVEGGAVWCWGDNYRGKLGNGALRDEGPLQTKPLSGPAIAVSVGRFHSCAIAEDRSLWCWGANDGGQLGTGNQEHQGMPREIMADVTSVGAGLTFTCALDGRRAVWCWGDNKSGALGHDSGNRLTPSETAVPCP